MLTISFLIINYCEVYKDSHSFKSKFLHVILSLEFLITFFYWGILHDGSDFDDNIEYCLCVARHVFPITYLMLEFIHNDLKLDSKSFWHLFGVLLSYGTVNFITTCKLNIQIYSVITWNSKTDIYFMILALSIAYMGWLMFLFLQMLKKPYEKLKLFI